MATFGSLGDLHPKIAIGLELTQRGHNVAIASMEYYREKIESLGLEFFPMAPHLDPDDQELARDLVDANKGSEAIIRGLVMPNIRQMYDDIVLAIDGADLLVTGEVVYAAKSVVETTGIRWVSTSLMPLSLFSAMDPPVPPQAPWMSSLRFLGPAFHRAAFRFARGTIKSWYKPYREFRRSLGLDQDHDPIFDGKYSNDLHLALFSKVLALPQPDWPPATLQTGFCFFDEHLNNDMPAELQEFLDAGEPPIVFTLGSAAVLDARDFFDQSVEAARSLGRRAVMLYGLFSEPPRGLDAERVGFGYAPYSQVFGRAACVVHQGGAGTTGQSLRAGVPQLIVPFGHDQPDNAARCRRAGVAESITRGDYNAETAAAKLKKILSDGAYAAAASEAAEVVRAEHGTKIASDAIEDILRKPL